MKKVNTSTQGKTNWKKLRSMTEEAILEAAKSDPDALPVTGDALREFQPVHLNEVPSVFETRQQLGMSQALFSKYFGVSVRTLQEWEQGRRQPSTVACHFLRVISKYPHLVNEALCVEGR